MLSTQGVKILVQNKQIDILERECTFSKKWSLMGFHRQTEVAGDLLALCLALKINVGDRCFFQKMQVNNYAVRKKSWDKGRQEKSGGNFWLRALPAFCITLN